MLGSETAAALGAMQLPWTDLTVVSRDAATLPEGLAMKLFKNPATSEYEYTPPAKPGLEARRPTRPRRCG